LEAKNSLNFAKIEIDNLKNELQKCVFGGWKFVF
jgi:hypothetical protein